MIRLRNFVLMTTTALTLAACAPSVSPLYRDYEVRAVRASEEASPDVYARIRAALDHLVRAGEVRTRDMGGQASTVEFSDALVRALG